MLVFMNQIHSKIERSQLVYLKKLMFQISSFIFWNKGAFPCYDILQFCIWFHQTIKFTKITLGGGKVTYKIEILLSGVSKVGFTAPTLFLTDIDCDFNPTSKLNNKN